MVLVGVGELRGFGDAVEDARHRLAHLERRGSHDNAVDVEDTESSSPAHRRTAEAHSGGDGRAATPHAAGAARARAQETSKRWSDSRAAERAASGAVREVTAAQPQQQPIVITSARSLRARRRSRRGGSAR